MLPSRDADDTHAHAQALQSPCLGCADQHRAAATSRCTRSLCGPWWTLDYAGYLLNFTGLELGLDGSGKWSVYFRQSCRHLLPTDGSCTLHGSAAQPIVCQQYNPYQCWYKRVMTVAGSDEFVRVDRRRLGWILERTRYDERRRIASSPSWTNVVPAFEELPLGVTPLPHPTPAAPTDPGVATDPAAHAVTSTVAAAPAGRPGDATGDRGGPRQYADLTAGSPCDGCAAFGCSRVASPLTTPHSVASLDFLRFSLGFPGVTIGVTDRGWRLIVSAGQPSGHGLATRGGPQASWPASGWMLRVSLRRPRRLTQSLT